MRHAWFALGAYVLISILLGACFEWSAYKSGVVEDVILLPRALFYCSAFIAGLVIFIRLALKRAFAPALIYASIAGSVIVLSAFASNKLSFDMQMKARIFAAYPDLCQTPVGPGQRVSICYAYSIESTGGEGEQVYFNPGDELSLPPNQWPDYIKRFFNIRDINAEYELCGVRKTKRIIDHVYWMSYDCWRH
jgi:hypothetical protein